MMFNLGILADAAAPVQHESQFVLRRTVEPVRWFGKDIDGTIYWPVVGLLLAAGLVYVVWMYIRDSRSVGWGWASFMGTLRCLVYLILAGIFMLPALETFEKTETYARVVVLFDVSGSMRTKDLPPSAGQTGYVAPADAVLNRQDQIIDLLTRPQIAFLKRLRDRNPVVLYRFGQQLDPAARPVEATEKWSKPLWQKWLSPDENVAIPDGLSPEEKNEYNQLAPDARVRFVAAKKTLYAGLVTGTNLYESVQAALNRESNNRLQGIIVVSDGRNTQFSQQTLEAVKKLAKRREVPIFTVGVGVERIPVKIMDPVVEAPGQVWPEDKFPIRVDVDAQNLPDHEVPIRLAIYKPKSNPKKDKPAYEIEQKGRFSKDGAQPHAQVEFIIDPAQMPPDLLKPDAQNGKPELAEGEYKVVARIARDPLETGDQKVHASDPAAINVQRKPIRVLLFAQGPTKDYQFLRTLLAREVEKGRAELSVRLQLASQDAVQDVEPKRFLKRFPGTFHDIKDASEDPYDNLAQYDVIIAFDPDWTELTAEQAQLLQRWVESHFGGLVVVGGPVNTFQLTNSKNFQTLKPIVDLYPVVLDDSRVRLGMDERGSTEPFRLNFPGANKEMDFLKLDEEDPDPLGGWDSFFTGKKRSEGGDTAPLLRGFFSYYPVKDKKPAAVVVATYADPRARLGDKEQPWMVYMPVGNGKVFYISSGEMWRLRQDHEAYHERFWTKLCHYMGSGNIGRLTTQGEIYMAPTFTSGGYVTFQAHLFGRDMRPLDGRGEAPRPDLSVVPPGVVKPKLEPMRYKQGSDGWFEGRFIAPAEGTYELSLTVPTTSVTLTKRFIIKEANPEKDNTMPDFAALKELASDAGPVLHRIKELDRKPVLAALQQTNKVNGAGAVGDPKMKLFFNLSNAKAIPDCMIADPRPLRTRGQDKDLWDAGFVVDDATPRAHVLSYALLAIIGLLSIEWLTRKLLKLA